MVFLFAYALVRRASMVNYGGNRSPWQDSFLDLVKWLTVIILLRSKRIGEKEFTDSGRKIAHLAR